MDFFNKLGKKASETYKEASEKTSKIAKEAKLKMKMSEAKSKINDMYSEIGKKVYENYTLKGLENIESELEDEITKIDILTAEIESCLKEIMKLKDKKQCEKCFAEIDINAQFCDKCGAKQGEEVSDVEVPENIENNENVDNNVIEVSIEPDNQEGENGEVVVNDTDECNDDVVTDMTSEENQD